MLKTNSFNIVFLWDCLRKSTMHGSKKIKLKSSIIYKMNERVKPNSLSGEEKFKLCK